MRKEEVVYGIKYYISLTIIWSILYGIVYIFMFSVPFYRIFDIYKWNSILGMNKEISAIIIIVLMIILGIANLFIGGAWIHLWIRIFGGKEKYYQTIKALAYANTPNLLLGWFPLINMAGAIWSFVLLIIGIKEYHEMSALKVLLALIVSAVMMSIIFSAVIFLIFILFFSSTG